NGVVFALLFVALVVLAMRESRQPVRIASPTLLVVGSCLIAFGWFYPHFVKTPHWTVYAYASPFGLLPCPTLAAVIGVPLMVEGLPSTAGSAVLRSAGC